MPTAQRVTIVCLPDHTPVDQLATTATATLATHPDTGTVTPFAHFATRRRFRTGRLLHPSNHTAAGGPLRLFDLKAMAVASHGAYAARFHIWQQVVTQTRPAQPYWTFLERHRSRPATYTLDHAQQHYLAQPRVAAMRTYNLMPHRLTDLPTHHLEAFQAGGPTYSNIGALTALPANAVLTLDGRLLHPASDQLADLLTFLSEANTYLHHLCTAHQVVALVTT